MKVFNNYDTTDYETSVANRNIKFIIFDNNLLYGPKNILNFYIYVTDNNSNILLI